MLEKDVDRSLYIASLINEHRAGTLTASRQVELEEWLNENGANRELFDSLVDAVVVRTELEAIKAYGIEESKARLMKELGITTETKLISVKWRIYAAAAAIVIAIITGAVFFLSKHDSAHPLAEQQVKTDIGPGRQGAILTLADGKKIVLDNASNGTIAQQGTTEVIKAGNQINLRGAGTGAVVFNTMTTPRGRQFSVVLADGTKIWLNAASCITYPTAFTGDAREVEITGEAYFEVAKQMQKVKGTMQKTPFLVKANGTVTEVLGTHFNVNAYEDENALKVTLLEGSVIVKAETSKPAMAGQAVKLKPGEQAVAIINNKLSIIKPDLEQVMSWKNGFFSFQNTGIKEIMRELSRWYDVEVVYQGEPKEVFTGEIDRNLTLSQVLKGLSDSRVNFRIEGKKLIIL